MKRRHNQQLSTTAPGGERVPRQSDEDKAIVFCVNNPVNTLPRQSDESDDKTNVLSHLLLRRQNDMVARHYQRAHILLVRALSTCS